MEEPLTTKLTKADTHLGAAHADDAVDAAAGIVEEGHGDCVLAGRQPVAFGGRVDLKDMGFGAVHGLLPLKNTHKQNNKSRQVRDAQIEQDVVLHKTEWTELICAQAAGTIISVIFM